MIAFIENIINLILPPRCLKCGKVLSKQNGLCSDCFQKINFISAPMCDICGFPFKGEGDNRNKICASCLKKKKHIIEKHRSVFVYDDFSKSMIIDLKFRDSTSYAEALARMMYSAGRDIWQECPDLLIPVPIHKYRLLKRHYNQSVLLVKALSKISNVKADYFNLIRVKNTIPQMELSAAARCKNLTKAFAVKNKGDIAGKKVVIIDDVATTGSTINECAKVLKKSGAAKVYALTLSRTAE